MTSSQQHNKASVPAKQNRQPSTSQPARSQPSQQQPVLNVPPTTPAATAISSAVAAAAPPTVALSASSASSAATPAVPSVANAGRAAVVWGSGSLLAKLAAQQTVAHNVSRTSVTGGGKQLATQPASVSAAPPPRRSIPTASGNPSAAATQQRATLVSTHPSRTDDTAVATVVADPSARVHPVPTWPALRATNIPAQPQQQQPVNSSNATASAASSSSASVLSSSQSNVVLTAASSSSTAEPASIVAGTASGSDPAQLDALTPSPLTGTLISNKQRKRAAKEQQRQQLQELEEAQRLEVEALQSIYLDDVSVLSTIPSIVQSKPPLPSILSITVLPEPLLDRAANNHAVLSVLLSYAPLAVPPSPPSIELQAVRGVNSELLENVRQRFESQKQRLWAEDVRHDGIMVSLCGLLQDWLREHNVENVSFYEEMRRREQREEEEREKERRDLELRAEREERERKERLALDIEHANRRKERAMHEEKRLRHQQQLHGATHTKANISPVVSPLPAPQTVKRTSSEEKKEHPHERGAAAERISPLSSLSPPLADINARQLKAKIAKARQQEKKMLQKERDRQRSGKQHRTHIDDDDDAPQSNPVQQPADGESDEDEESDSEEDDDEKEGSNDDEQEDVEALFPSSFNLSGSLSFFDQKKKNERDLLAELDNRGRKKGVMMSDSSSDDEDGADEDGDVRVSASDDEASDRDTAARHKRRPSQTSPSKLKLLSSSNPAANDIPALTVSLSRYRNDFEELQLLGKGGFGAVYKVRNRVDKLLYAVKKIRLRRRGAEENRRIIREVSTIGMLHHSYIVRYYQAWIEAEEEGDSGEGGDAWRVEDDNEAGSDWLSSSYNTSSYLREVDEDEQEDEAKEGRSSRRTSDRSNRPSQCLYIQMQYCPNKTLKDVIADRMCERSMETCWRLFRQTLEAVAYLHSKDIVHRDLKPANVFIDDQQSIKLGDFGLAVLTVGKQSGAKRPSSHPTATDDDTAYDDEDDSILSKESAVREVVGTVFYRSPEQEAVGVLYDEKADIYALGIILFELFQPFGSASERIAVLSELRKTHRVPGDFMRWREKASDVAEEKKAAARDREKEREKENELREERRQERDKITSIIHQLLAVAPTARPSAAALLRSGLIPLKMEDEYLELSLRMLSNRDNPHHSQLLDMLFSAPVDPLAEWTYDFASTSAPSLHVLRGGEGMVGTAPLPLSGSAPLPLSSYHLFQQRVFDVAMHHFRLHGATLFSTPLLLPQSTQAQLEEQHGQVSLLDDSGLLVKLPYTLTVPFARHVAQHATADVETARGRDSRGNGNLSWARNGLRAGHSELLSLDWRRFDIAKVYRKNPVGGRPKEVYECDFDCVWPAVQSVSHASPVVSSATPDASKEWDAYCREKKVCTVAECIKLSLDLLAHFSYALGPVLIRLNHHTLVDAVMQAVLPASTTASSSADVLSFLYRVTSHFSLAAVPFARSGLRKQLLKDKRLTERAVDWFGTAITLRADHSQLDVMMGRIRELLHSAPWRGPSSPSTSSLSASSSSSPSSTARQLLQRVDDALSDIRLLFDMLRAVGVAEYVVFDLGLTSKRDLYAHNITFQAFMHARPTFTSSARSPSSPSSPPLLSGPLSFDPIAVGGCYDSLLAAFRPPSSSLPLSGVGVNLAVEKLTAAVVDCHLHTRKTQTFPSFAAFFTSSSLHSGAIGGKAEAKSKKNKPGSARGMSASSLLSNPSSSLAPATFLPPLPPFSSSPLPSVLLYSPRHHLLRERLSLASLLWAEHFSCLYSVPYSLTYSLLLPFLRLHSIRFLLLMRRRQFKEQGVVELVDMDALSERRGWDRLVSRLKGKEATDGSQSTRDRERDEDEQQRERDSDREGVDTVLISEILSVLRQRAAHVKRDESEGGGHGSMPTALTNALPTASNSSAPSTSSTATSHSHSHHHSHQPAAASSTGAASQLHIQLIDPASAIKREAKANIITAARRAITPLCTPHIERIAVACAVDLPVQPLRSLSTVIMQAKTGDGSRRTTAASGADEVEEWIGSVAGKWRHTLSSVYEYIQKRQSEGECEYVFLYSISARRLVDVFML